MPTGQKADPPLRWADSESSPPAVECPDGKGLQLRDPGDPGHAPASFSRFVLPFAYALKKEEGCGTAPDPAAAGTGKRERWELARPSPLDGQYQYFTPETADVLYGRARVASLAEFDTGSGAFAKSKPERLTVDAGRYEVMIEPPRLVLFEWPVAIGDPVSGDPVSCDAPGDDPMLVGFLWYEVWFPQFHRDGKRQRLHLSDVLRFNEMFRYVRQPFEGHRAAPDGFDAFFATPAQVHPQPPETPGVPPAGSDGVARPSPQAPQDDDPYFDRWFPRLTLPLYDPDGAICYRLFPVHWEPLSRAWARGGSTTEAHAMCHPDDRAFVATFAQVAGGANSLLPEAAPLPDSLPPPGELDERTRRLMRAPGWLALLNVDKPGDFASAPVFWQNWAEARTYSRWAHYGTLYGFSPHSASAIADVCTEPPLCRHYRGHYFDQTMLLLYLRAVIFRISQRINLITAQERGKPADNKAFHALNRKISDFVNLYQFPFLSLQQQGVEMYALQRLHMDIDDLYREVCEEVQRTQAQIDMNKQIKLSDASVRLSELATWGIPMAAAALTGVAWNDLGLVHFWRKCVWPALERFSSPESADLWSAVAGVSLAVLAFSIVHRCVKRRMS